jgi:DNA modification methylase
LVLDPFMGAGSTAVAARTVGRDWLGIELNSTYRDLALTRIASTAVPRAPDLEEMHDPQGASHGAP